MERFILADAIANGGHTGPLIWVLVISLAMFFGSIALMWAIIVRLPENYLNRENGSDFGRQHPVARAILIIAKNAFGLLLVIMGVVMLLTPGQGVLSIFLGITLMDFPGKRKLIRRMLGGRRTLRMINRIRARAHRPPLERPRRVKAT